MGGAGGGVWLGGLGCVHAHAHTRVHTGWGQLGGWGGRMRCRGGCSGCRGLPLIALATLDQAPPTSPFAAKMAAMGGRAKPPPQWGKGAGPRG